MAVNLDRKYAIDERRVCWRILRGTAVILDLDKGVTYDLNASGTRIWKGIHRKRTLGSILASLHAAYGLPKKKLGADLAKLLKSMEKEKLIVPR